MQSHLTSMATICRFAATVVLVAWPVAARGDLDEYVRRPDPEFGYTVVDQTTSQTGTIYHLKLTSQVWQGIRWEHQLRIFEPAEVKYPDTMLLFITGGSQESKFRPEEALLGHMLARLCGTRCAVLPQVPNQPLLDGKKEDALIADTFLRYLKTNDDTWPLLFPMVKSAVRAMDALQAWGTENDKPAKQFVVTGASKRGWTTWLTAAVDKRVVAIAPMVIDTLNMRAQLPNQLKVWGKYSEQIEDYTRSGLVNEVETPAGERLWKMVDPYTYRDRIQIPKLLVHGTNDRYWTLDATHLYWNDLEGAKNVVYLPNAGHGLEQNRQYAVTAVAALLRHVVTGRKMPEIGWENGDGDNGSLRLVVRSQPAPKQAQLWMSRAATRDFRDAKWEPCAMTNGAGSVVGELPRPAEGFVAYFADLEFQIDDLPFHLSSLITQTGAKRPE